jgi:protein TonB
VILQAVISKEGTIENLHVVSGHPLLTQSALDAVKQWRYRPYILNGDPVEVETTVEVHFTLAGG